jgi:hypothetical protein
MFQLTKVWVDPTNDIDTIEIRYTWTAHGAEPDWEDDNAEVMHVVPDTDPKVRTAELEIPRYVNGTDSYLLHYRFGRGGEHHEGWSPIYTEEIVAKPVDYVDTEGRLTEVRLLWSIAGSMAPNWSQADLEGLSKPALRMHDPEQEGLADDAFYELIQAVPLPRRFVAKVWGPQGSTIDYSYQLLRTNTPTGGDEFEIWDDNGGCRYEVELTG